MLVVLTILGVLASIGLPLAELAHKRAQEEELRRDLRQIRDAIDAYRKSSDEGHIARFADESGYPPDLDALVSGVVDMRSPTRNKIYFLRRLPRDPFADADTLGAAETWALRSYESPPDDPKPGRNVFDVHSASQAVGTNGIPYRQW